MASRDTALASGREAFERQDWAEAERALTSADAQGGLDADDLEKLAVATYLVGRDADAIGLFKRSHQRFVDRGDRERAARCAFWVCVGLALGGEGAQGRGWLSRTERMLEDHPGCAEAGMLCAVAGMFQLFMGHPGPALDCFERACECAERFPDGDLMAFALVGRGQALIHDRRPSEGVSWLDEAMVVVTSGEASPMMAGLVYCAVILESNGLCDLVRAKEWTSALDDWCSSQPEMVQFRGACLTHRSQILQLQGDWTDAIEEAKRSCSWYSGRSERAGGRAFYQLAEMHRLRGELDLAEASYRDAARTGTEPQPGMSLLRLAQGQPGAAVASIKRVVAEPGGERSVRASVLEAYVEIMLAAGDTGAARSGADELQAIAASADAPVLRAQASHACGAVSLAEGDAGSALASLRESWGLWQTLDAPYEAARVRVLIAGACEAMDDSDTAEIHVDAARSVFERLGAQPALSALDGRRTPGTDVASRLTARELGVLALVAAGKTNRQIAAELFISEHTVARHLSNIFNKIDVTTRTAAAAFALENGLVRAPHGQD